MGVVNRKQLRHSFQLDHELAIYDEIQRLRHLDASAS